MDKFISPSGKNESSEDVNDRVVRIATMLYKGMALNGQVQYTSL